jgi:hypothetical protein
LSQSHKDSKCCLTLGSERETYREKSNRSEKEREIGIERERERENGKRDREIVMDSLEKDVRSALLQKMGISAADIDFVLESSLSGEAKSSQFRIFTRDDRVDRVYFNKVLKISNWTILRVG